MRTLNQEINKRTAYKSRNQAKQHNNNSFVSKNLLFVTRFSVIINSTL